MKDAHVLQEFYARASDVTEIELAGEELSNEEREGAKFERLEAGYALIDFVLRHHDTLRELLLAESQES